MTGIYLLLGSNIDNRLKNLERACELLIANGLAIRNESKVYETAAWGIEDQDSFLNQVIEVETAKSPQRLLFISQMIEKEMGRVKYEKWGSRLIDIDILYFGDVEFAKEDLIIPHPEIQNRRFTLVPMAEIAPELEHPVSAKNQIELLEECKDELEVNEYSVLQY